MKNNRNIKLKTYDDIFNATESLPENDIKNIDVNLLVGFRDHPFNIVENKEMDELYESIKENGILVPILVRPLGEKFEIISGHRRNYCAVKAGMASVPCIIKEIEYEDAIFVMLDSNIQRKNILPSEKAFSYKMKLSAIKRQGERGDLTSRQVVGKLSEESADIIGKDFNDSGRNVQRYIRLTELTPFLLEAIDKRKMSFGSGVEISYLSMDEQKMLEDSIVEFGKYPSLAQAKEMRGMINELNADDIRLILFDNYKAADEKILGTGQTALEDNSQSKEIKNNEVISLYKIRSFFPGHFTADEIEMAIIEILRRSS